MSKRDVAQWDDEAVDPEIRARAAARSTWVSVVVNTSLSALQVLVGLLSGSAGLIADGLHSLSDLVADFLVLFVSVHSRSDPDERHPYGHHRFENAASLALGFLLLMVGAAWCGLPRSGSGTTPFFQRSRFLRSMLPGSR
jgi:divalent metal cation (Fe/Co/Zn/Cd) transporter